MPKVLTEFRPIIWARQLIVDIDEALVYRNVANTDFQGEITQYGDRVKINEIGDVTINDYTESSDITVQTLTGAQKELIIDQSKYFAFEVDDVLTAQANVNVLQGGTQKAGFAMAKTIDTFLAGKYTEAGVPTENLGTSATGQDVYAASSGNDSILGAITNMHKALDEADAPSNGRWVVWPAWAHAYLKYAGIVDNLAGAIRRDDGTPVGNGFIGDLLGLSMYASNNVSNDGTDYRVMFGTQDALSFAGQVVEVESMRRENRFADMVRGLYVYGAKVVRPDHLGVAYLDPVGLSS